MERIVFACSLGLVACGPVVDVGPGTDDDGSESDEATTATSTMSTSATTSSGTTGMSSSSTTVGTTVEPTTASVTTDEPPPPPDDAGYCTLLCGAPIDCCMGEPTCESGLGTYPYDYGCENQTCTFGGCTSDEECTFGGVLQGYICVESDGYDVCMASCSNDQDCEDQFLTDWVCNGQFCDPPPCSSDEECGPDQQCSPDAGICTYLCTSDSFCEGVGHCDPDTGQCVCSSDDECYEGYGCQPLPQ